MAKKGFTPDEDAISSILTGGAVTSMVNEVAQEIASNARAAYPDPHSDGPVEVEVVPYTASGGKLTGERAAASVIATHPAALLFEAKHGVLYKAAAASGASQVKRKR